MANETEQAGVILAIESAIGGGSISLARGGNPVAGTPGGGSVSRAEDLLIEIDSLLDHAEVVKRDLVCIAVSTGPGSYTGLRIGLSTAMGLAAALEIPCTGIPLFDAISAGFGSTLAVVVPQGRSDLCYRLFDNGIAQGDYLVGDISEFIAFVQTKRPRTVACHPDIELSTISTPDGVDLVNTGHDLAKYIGRYAADRACAGPLEPIYVRNPRFA